MDAPVPRCLACGYDLSETTQIRSDERSCPECGQVTSAATIAAVVTRAQRLAPSLATAALVLGLWVLVATHAALSGWCIMAEPPTQGPIPVGTTAWTIFSVSRDYLFWAAATTSILSVTVLPFLHWCFVLGQVRYVQRKLARRQALVTATASFAASVVGLLMALYASYIFEPWEW